MRKLIQTISVSLTACLVQIFFQGKVYGGSMLILMIKGASQQKPNSNSYAGYTFIFSN